jgi:hypothetical protein
MLAVPVGLRDLQIPGGSMADNAVLYTAVYNDVASARADLDAVEEMHRAQMIGKYDAAIIDKEDGEPHIVKRMDRPAIRIIPEWLGSGTLRRRDLHDVAKELNSGESALIVVGEPTVEQGLEQAVIRANRTFKRDIDATADELEEELLTAVKKGGAES